MRTMLVCAMVFGLTSSAWSGGDRPNEIDLKDVPLRLELKAIKKTYTLDLGGKTAAEFLKMLEQAGKPGGVGGPLPKPPAVDLQLVVSNTGKENIDFWYKGDPVEILLDVKGPKAKTIQPPLAFTLEFRLPEFHTLKPGAKFVFPINALSFGHRGTSMWAYWLEPGEYTIAAQLKTGLRPPPPAPGEGVPLTLQSEAIKVQVEK